ncbi:uncharacterized protein LOC106069968 isoform X1 [Biomphalaria glabrata]|uniref:Uncharacterized protein LOC106069968 isoform X1 n=1 Tax=Biomphalaria glabrata TaxID=6526 RepID=A0A9W3AYI5_BIOGL|nr:uncharacterized protein LOC106069968 isoform X1 [Biomphalaria glabrata]
MDVWRNSVKAPKREDNKTSKRLQAHTIQRGDNYRKEHIAASINTNNLREDLLLSLSSAIDCMPSTDHLEQSPPPVKPSLSEYHDLPPNAHNNHEASLKSPTTSLAADITSSLSSAALTFEINQTLPNNLSFTSAARWKIEDRNINCNSPDLKKLPTSLKVSSKEVFESSSEERISPKPKRDLWQKHCPILKNLTHDRQTLASTYSTYSCSDFYTALSLVDFRENISIKETKLHPVENNGQTNNAKSTITKTLGANNYESTKHNTKKNRKPSTDKLIRNKNFSCAGDCCPQITGFSENVFKKHTTENKHCIRKRSVKASSQQKNCKNGKLRTEDGKKEKSKLNETILPILKCNDNDCRQLDDLNPEGRKIISFGNELKMCNEVTAKNTNSKQNDSKHFFHAFCNKTYKRAELDHSKLKTSSDKPMHHQSACTPSRMNNSSNILETEEDNSYVKRNVKTVNHKDSTGNSKSKEYLKAVLKLCSRRRTSNKKKPNTDKTFYARNDGHCTSSDVRKQQTHQVLGCSENQDIIHQSDCIYLENDIISEQDDCALFLDDKTIATRMSNKVHARREVEIDTRDTVRDEVVADFDDNDIKCVDQTKHREGKVVKSGGQEFDGDDQEVDLCGQTAEFGGQLAGSVNQDVDIPGKGLNVSFIEVSDSEQGLDCYSKERLDYYSKERNPLGPNVNVEDQNDEVSDQDCEVICSPCTQCSQKKSDEVVRKSRSTKKCSISFVSRNVENMNFQTEIDYETNKENVSTEQETSKNDQNTFLEPIRKEESIFHITNTDKRSIPNNAKRELQSTDREEQNTFLKASNEELHSVHIKHMNSQDIHPPKENGEDLDAPNEASTLNQIPLDAANSKDWRAYESTRNVQTNVASLKSNFHSMRVRQGKRFNAAVTKCSITRSSACCLPTLQSLYECDSRYSASSVSLFGTKCSHGDTEKSRLEKLSRPHGASPVLRLPATLPKHIDDDTPAICDPEIQAFHDQLSSSLQTFQPKIWRPLTPDFHRAITPCHRPSSGRCTGNGARPMTAMSDPVRTKTISRLGLGRYLPQRPDTPRVSQGDFDTLTPRIISELIPDIRPRTPTATYGSIGKEKQLSSEHCEYRQTCDELSDDEFVASSGEDDDKDGFSDNDSISELERGSEPLVDRNRTIPEIRLRPENPDSAYIPPRKSDMRRFDFDAENSVSPEYQFQCPLPLELTKINMRHCAVNKVNWRCSSYAANIRDPLTHKMMDRLIEIERHQVKTEKWEAKRFKKQKRKNPLIKPHFPKPKDKRCCQACLQPACAGDCPLKRARPDVCTLCRQQFCTGTCSETKYDQRMRLPREDTEIMPQSSINKACKTCQGQNNAKVINLTYVEVGRPNSAFITFSRGQGSAVIKRPSSAECFPRAASKSKQEPKQILSRHKKQRGRNGLSPGRSFNSNLTLSLTELSLLHQ